MYAYERPQARLVFRLVSAIRDRRRRRGAIRDLRRMSDLQLTDIGIERHRISEVVDGLMAKNAAKDEDRPACHDGCSAAVFHPVAPA